MLRCPKCNRTYQDDMQKFCTHDGGRLAPDIEKPKSFDPNATVTGDAGDFDIPVEPDSGTLTLQDLGATIAAPLAAQLTSTPSAEPSPTGFRTPDTAPTVISDTSKVEELSPQPPAQFPTVMAPPPPAPPLPNSDVSLSTPVVPIDRPALEPQPAVPAESTPSVMPSAPVAAPPKKSRLGLVAVIVGALLLVVLVGGGIAGYFLIIRERGPHRGREITVEPKLKTDSNSGNNTPAAPTEIKSQPANVPPNSVKFENSSSKLDRKLAEHYVDFYFYYPKLWQSNPKAGVPGAANFVEVERKLPPDYTQENVTVSWYDSKGTVDSDLAGKLPALIKTRNASLAATLPEYQKVSEGKTTINGIEGYEFRFKAASRGTDKGDIYIWGRVVYLPPGDETSTKGVTLYMFTTSLAPELKSVEDVGVKGELPVILNSFTLGKS
jgi:hypothetical protein